MGRRAAVVLIIVGSVLLAGSAACYVVAAAWQTMATSRIVAAMDGGGGGRQPAALSPALIEIGRVGLAAAIREGTDPRTLLVAVGHVPGTALPGEDGNVVLTGHRDTFFRRLRHVRAGDWVRVVAEGGPYLYQVEATFVVGPDRTEVMDPAGGRTLTLITCYPFGFIGSAPKRFIVRARQVMPQEA